MLRISKDDFSVANEEIDRAAIKTMTPDESRVENIDEIIEDGVVKTRKIEEGLVKSDLRVGIEKKKVLAQLE